MAEVTRQELIALAQAERLARERLAAIGESNTFSLSDESRVALDIIYRSARDAWVSATDAYNYALGKSADMPKPRKEVMPAADRKPPLDTPPPVAPAPPGAHQLPPWLAEPGTCPSCDRRRADTAAKMRALRERRKR